LGAPPSARNIKYARIYHSEKKNAKIFFPEGPRENVWGPRKNVSLGPAVALDEPAKIGVRVIGKQDSQQILLLQLW